jgi:hypothetical protein
MYSSLFSWKLPSSHKMKCTLLMEEWVWCTLHLAQVLAPLHNILTFADTIPKYHLLMIILLLLPGIHFPFLV